MTGQKTALLGGSFDPVHKGHISAAVQIRKILSLDRVVLVPNYRNPLKRGDSGAGAGGRLEMLRLATADIEGVEVSEVEAERKSVSYTVDTLRVWKDSGKSGSLWFVMGKELFSDITKWKNFREIFEIANVAVISRAGAEENSGPPFEIREDFRYDKSGMETVCFNHKSGSKLLFAEIDSPDISSTEIRKRIKNGEDFEGLVPPEVADFIKRNKLYTGEPAR
ncbi:MAG: nicotinate-nucleotide adenylyltransferase [Thermodesulfobacteriota bacterium]